MSRRRKSHNQREDNVDTRQESGSPALRDWIAFGPGVGSELKGKVWMCLGNSVVDPFSSERTVVVFAEVKG